VEGEISGRALSAALLFLPINLKYRKSDEEWISAITNEWNHLELNMGTVEAERKYLETVQRWPYYGGNVFHVESKQFPQANAIVISKDGLGIFCLPEKEPLASAAFKGILLLPLQALRCFRAHPPTAIFNWSSPNRDTVGVVVGSLMNPQRYVFTTSQVCVFSCLLSQTELAKSKIHSGRPTKWSKRLLPTLVGWLPRTRK